MRFEKLFPDHRTVLLPNASHFLQEDAGDQIAAEIKQFAGRPTDQKLPDA